MKRSAAIIGNTPQFVRWAIAKACPLRQLDLEQLPSSTFSQLRSIRALATGIAEDRVFEQICFHSAVESPDDETARGFPIDEVLDLVGGIEVLDQSCQPCPANASAGTGAGAWAGCYGWLPADISWSLNSAAPQSIVKPNEVREDLPALVNEVIRGEFFHKFEAAYGELEPWYGLWRNRVLNENQLNVLNSTLGTIAGLKSEVSPVKHLWDATKRCLSSQLDLHVQLVPPGFSDGTTWKVSAHCPDCHCAIQIDGACAGCYRAGNFSEARELKVLGYRPYLMLKLIMGEKEAAGLVRRYCNRNQQRD